MTNQIYLFFGDEDFFIDQELKRIGGANLEVLEGEKVAAGDIVQALQTTPMFGGQKLVVVKNTPLFKISRKGREEKKKEDVEPLIASLENISPEVKVVFVNFGNIDRRKRLSRFIESEGELKEFKPFAPWQEDQLIAWIVEQVKNSGKKIGLHAARRLAETSGSGLRQLSQEIEKLITYIGEKGAIEEKDVNLLASSGRTNVFSLLSALREKNLPLSLKILHRLLKDKEGPIALVGLLATQFRMLAQVKSLQDKKKDVYEIARILGGSPYFVKKSFQDTHNFTLSELKDILKFLHEVDLKLKTTSVSPALLLEFLLTQICTNEL